MAPRGARSAPGQLSGPGPLAGFSLVAGGTGNVLAELVEGAVVVTDDYSTTSFAIRANLATGETVGSIVLELVRDSVTAERTEGYAPYSLYGDEGHQNLTGMPLPAGNYQLTATAYSETGGGGEEEGRLTVSFTVVESAPTPGETTNETQPVPANLRATGAPTIVGTAQVGETLTVDTSGIADEDGLEDATFSYQWVRNDGATGTNIEDATGSSYTLTEDDEGKAITVTVTFTDAAGNQETLTSTETAAVEPAPNSEATGAPTIGGTARLGETLTADTSATADEDGLDSAVFSYRWIRNDGTEDAEIADATGVDYTLVPDDVG